MSLAEGRNIMAAAYIIGAFLLLLAVWKTFSRGKRLRLPPGPPGWPVLGHIPSLGKWPHVSLVKLSQKYGPLMSIRLGSCATVVASSPEMARIFLRSQDHLFASRPPSIVGEIFVYNYQDVVLSPYTDQWRRARKIFESELFSRKRLPHVQHIGREQILATVERLTKAGRAGRLVEIDPHITHLSLDIMCRIGFSRRSSDSAGEQRNGVYSLLLEFCTAMALFPVGDYIPFLRRLDLGGVEESFLKLRAKFENFLTPIIEEHRQKPDEDFLSALLALQQDPSVGGFPDEAIIALLMNVLIAGTETVANTTIWALTEVMRHPEVQEKITDELDSVVGRQRLVEFADLNSLKYLKAVVKEAFRMHPVAALGLPHVAMEDTKAAGYDILKGTRVLVNFFALGRDPTSWSNPNNFVPERFINDKLLDVRGHHFELLPFSTGRRMCPGMEMGLERVEMTLAQMFQTCILSLPPGMEVDVEEGVGSALPRAHHLQVLVSPRLAQEIYNQYDMRL
ncbi:hypothetical protein R1flu_005565 [Riccia fluitans]|uniref:Cytochrome P450 n=1 Tax=Riccia fluitans TaxID=41844 RepID=A0ABD1YU36_9MARC